MSIRNVLLILLLGCSAGYRRPFIVQSIVVQPCASVKLRPIMRCLHWLIIGDKIGPTSQANKRYSPSNRPVLKAHRAYKPEAYQQNSIGKFASNTEMLSERR